MSGLQPNPWQHSKNQRLVRDRIYLTNILRLIAWLPGGDKFWVLILPPDSKDEVGAMLQSRKMERFVPV